MYLLFTKQIKINYYKSVFLEIKDRNFIILL